MRDNVHDLTVPVELLIEAATGFNEPEVTETYVCLIQIILSNKQRFCFQDVTGITKTRLPQIHIYTKQEQYEDLRAYLKQAWKQFLRRPIPVVY